ncbi:hypothetical protein [Streptomyces sp. NPDC003247]|uniref:hypothetical protein n=1 Tax=Streptomyces sp. NPDC003247 TaxID=3364677 RepID=UPI0036BFB396
MSPVPGLGQGDRAESGRPQPARARRDDPIDTTDNGDPYGGHLEPLGPEDPREVAGYRLLARIGEGGRGAVCLSHTRGRQAVALKVIRREHTRDAEFRRRFRQEVLAARKVQGHHVVPVVDHDTAGTLPWLATVYVPGLALDEAVGTYGPLPLPTVLRLTACTAEARRAEGAAAGQDGPDRRSSRWGPNETGKDSTWRKHGPGSRMRACGGTTRGGASGAV